MRVRAVLAILAAFAFVPALAPPLAAQGAVSADKGFIVVNGKKYAFQGTLPENARKAVILHDGKRYEITKVGLGRWKSAGPLPDPKDVLKFSMDDPHYPHYDYRNQGTGASPSQFDRSADRRPKTTRKVTPAPGVGNQGNAPADPLFDLPKPPQKQGYGFTPMPQTPGWEWKAKPLDPGQLYPDHPAARRDTQSKRDPPAMKAR